MIANDRAESESSLEVHRDVMRKYEYEFECNLLHMLNMMLNSCCCS